MSVAVLATPENCPLRPIPTPEATPTPIGVSDIIAASKTIANHALRTPVMMPAALAECLGAAAVAVKCEHLQRTGAFKFRGALNAMSRLDNEARARGVLTYSSGNHAQAIALAGRMLGVHTTIIMPSDAPTRKRVATRDALGTSARPSDGKPSQIVEYNKNETTREALGDELVERHGLTLIPPYDHPHVIAGQGTAALELIEEAGPLDTLYVCLGGGGLTSGSAIAAKALNPECIVVGVEPERADDAFQSIRTGTLHVVRNPDTIADGTRTPFLGHYTFPLIAKNVDRIVTVSEREIASALRFAMDEMRQVIEPSGALGIAGAIREGTETLAGKRVGIVISGGNVDLDCLPQLLALAAGET
ncbi:MAG: pyridoxal-phosphate dependent enzyme [Planctomycetota bacterium]